MTKLRCLIIYKDIYLKMIFVNLKVPNKKQNTFIQLYIMYRAGFLDSDPRGSRKFREFLDKYGDQHIMKLLVVRKPIFPIIEKIANLISLGKYEQVKSKF